MQQQSAGNQPQPDALKGPWKVRDGALSTGASPAGFTEQGVERLDYSNAYAQNVERVWYEGKLVFAVDAGRIHLPSAKGIKVAQEYQPVYSIELDEHGKLEHQEKIPGQYNIYDSVPGMDKYSPIWQFNYVVVPRDYNVQSLRSEADCLNSGYPIQKANVFEN